MRGPRARVASHEWTVADDGTPSCYRCGMVKRPDNARVPCPAVPDGRGGWTYSRLPNGEWRCIRDNRTEPCGDCDGCREVQGLNALTGGSEPNPTEAPATNDHSK